MSRTGSGGSTVTRAAARSAISPPRSTRSWRRAGPDGRRAVGEAAPTAPHLVFDWAPGGLAPAAGPLAEEVAGSVESAVCPHPGGPPSCWCRPPLPGLPLAFARRHGVEPSRSILVGVSAAHRALATTLGARYVSPRATTA